MLNHFQASTFLDVYDRTREDIVNVQNLLYLTDPIHIQGTNLVVIDVAEGALVVLKGRPVGENPKAEYG
jgi:Ni2+-binding GTPase involved in maturation of urease and hydrogenase